MSLHDGHRARLKKRFLEYGAEGIDDVNLLELLLFFALPRVDTNETAHELLDRFGSIDGVLEASADELRATPGVGESATVLLKLIPTLAKRYLAAKNSIGSILASTEDAGDFLLPRFLGERDETVLLVCMDTKMKVVSCRKIASGDVSVAHLSIRKVVEQALAQNAPYVILAHNHIGGFALPSVEDVNATLQLRDALSLVGVTLIDHIVVSGDDFVSMKDDGSLAPDE